MVPRCLKPNKYRTKISVISLNLTLHYLLSVSNIHQLHHGTHLVYSVNTATSKQQDNLCHRIHSSYYSIWDQKRSYLVKNEPIPGPANLTLVCQSPLSRIWSQKTYLSTKRNIRRAYSPLSAGSRYGKTEASTILSSLRFMSLREKWDRNSRCGQKNGQVSMIC